LPNEGSEAQGADQVTFYIGADKLILSDSDITNSTNGGTEYQVGEHSVDGTDVQITGYIANSIAKISSIQVKYTPNDEIYVPLGDKLSDKLDDANALFTKTFDYQFTGLTDKNTEMIKLYKSNSHEYNLEYTAKDGATFNHELFFANSSTGTVYLGYGYNNPHAFHVNESEKIAEDDLFVVTAGDYSHIFQYKDIDLTNDDIKIKDLNTGDIDTLSYDNSNATTLYFHGYAIDINVTTNGKLKVDMYDGGNIAPIKTANGAEITFNGFGDNDTTNNIISVQSEKLEHSGSTTNPPVNISLTWNNDSHKLNAVYDSGLYPDDNNVTIHQIGESDKEEGYNQYGLHLVQDGINGQNTITIEYPDSQVFADVYVTGEKVTTAAATSGAVNVNYINAASGVARIDTDFATTTPDKPVILIGGPGANKMVKSLADAGLTDSVSDYAQDTAIIQLIEDAYGTNDALIIAGYAAKDTNLAGKVVTARLVQDQFADKLTGDKVVLNTAAGTLSGVEFE